MNEREANIRAAIDHYKNAERFAPVIGTSLADGSEIYFECVADAEKEGFNRTCIQNVLAGRRKTHRGFFWKRAEKEA